MRVPSLETTFQIYPEQSDWHPMKSFVWKKAEWRLWDSLGTNLPILPPVIHQRLREVLAMRAQIRETL